MIRSNDGVRSRLAAVAAMAAIFTLMSATPALAAAPTSVTVVVSGTVAPTGEATFELEGVGAGSRLGAFTYHGDVVITGVTDNGITDTLTETLTFGNGDSVTILCLQEAAAVGPGLFVGSDSWTVIGGTGRYANATGSGTGTTHVDLNAGTFTKVFDGTINR
ncbi:MAG: hypothetical protein OEY70_16985 [Acidimicrobiia bacterium]|nr:hypothetical protein [Acidimicrobiia bacterium]